PGDGDDAGGEAAQRVAEPSPVDRGPGGRAAPGCSGAVGAVLGGGPGGRGLHDGAVRASGVAGRHGRRPSCAGPSSSGAAAAALTQALAWFITVPGFPRLVTGATSWHQAVAWYWVVAGRSAPRHRARPSGTGAAPG